MQIEALIEWMEGLSGPDRETDLEIHMAACPHLYEGKWRWDDVTQPPPLTASLDAATALVGKVLPGWSGDVDIGQPIANFGKLGVRLFPPGDGWKNYAGEGPTPAIALCLALLRALAAGGSDAW